MRRATVKAKKTKKYKEKRRSETIEPDIVFACSFFCSSVNFIPEDSWEIDERIQYYVHSLERADDPSSQSVHIVGTIRRMKGRQLLLHSMKEALHGGISDRLVRRGGPLALAE